LSSHDYRYHTRFGEGTICRVCLAWSQTLVSRVADGYTVSRIHTFHPSVSTELGHTALPNVDSCPIYCALPRELTRRPRRTTSAVTGMAEVPTAAVFRDDPFLRPLQFARVRLETSAMPGSASTPALSEPKMPELSAAVAANLTLLGPFSVEREVTRKVTAAIESDKNQLPRRPIRVPPAIAAAAAPSVAPVQAAAPTHDVDDPILSGTMARGAALHLPSSSTAAAAAAPSGTWACGICTFVNEDSSATCGACDTAKPAPRQASVPASSLGRPGAGPAGLAARPSAEWGCPVRRVLWRKGRVVGSSVLSNLYRPIGFSVCRTALSATLPARHDAPYVTGQRPDSRLLHEVV
jgi:hypothetical protein